MVQNILLSVASAGRASCFSGKCEQCGCDSSGTCVPEVRKYRCRLWCVCNTKSDSTRPVSWEGGENLLSNGLTIVPDNKQAGTVNGARLASAAPYADPRSPLAAAHPLSSARVIVRCEARHNHAKGENRKSDSFRNIRKALHLRVGAKVMLCLNRIWNVSTVPLGLMNGARGIIVAISYAPLAQQRSDAQPLAETGFPQAADKGLPHGLNACPIPNFIIVHFPEYTGLSIFPGLPRTWVPIPAEQVSSETTKSLFRVNMPLRLAWSLTFHKCQGLTATEGIILSFLGSKMVSPCSKAGLPFVGWTRATSWSRVAFHGLPPLQEFLNVRTSQEFRCRTSFESVADSNHDAFLVRNGVTQQQQVDDHKRHLESYLAAVEGRGATSDELKDIEFMLSQRGVAPVSDSVKLWITGSTEAKSQTNFWTMMSSFKGSKRARDVGEGKASAAKRARPSNASCGEHATKALLHQRGYKAEHIEAALRAVGPDLTKCESYIEQLKAEMPTESFTQVVASEETWAHNVMHEIGFSESDITRALQITSYNFPKALSLLLYGDVNAKTHHRLMQRHTSKRPVALTLTGTPDERVDHYTQRAQEELNVNMQVHDFGIHAQRTVNACFWLCMAAALSRLDWRPPSSCRSLFSALDAARTAPLPADVNEVRHSAIAEFADQLRAHMCHGSNAVLRRLDTRDKIFQAFAALGGEGRVRTFHAYDQWVNKLAQEEFADELVVLATSLEVGVRIVCVPYTPQGAVPWAISRYPSEDRGVISDVVVHLGNDDVHYVWLAPTDE